MAVRLAALVVTGTAGSGRSTELRRWTAEADRARRIAPRVLDAAFESTTGDALLAWHRDTDVGVALAVDDAELLDESVHSVLASISAERAIGVAAATWPTSGSLDRLVDRLIEGTPAADPATVVRCAPLTAARAAEWFDVAPDLADVLVARTAGNPALLAAAVRHGWDGDLQAVPVELVDAVVRRLRRLRPGVLDTALLVSMGVDVGPAMRLAEQEPTGSDGGIERALAASGLVDHRADPVVIAPLALAAAEADASDDDRARVADSVLGRLDDGSSGLSALALAALRLASTIASPIERALSAVRLGHPAAGAIIAELPDLAEPLAAQADFADDVRHLRLDRATSRTLPSDPLGSAVMDVTLAMTGHASRSDVPLPAGESTTAAGVWLGLEAALATFAAGEVDRAVTVALRVHDDAVRARLDTLAGITPSALVSLLLLQAGRPDRARDVSTDALRHDLGGPGERRTHTLLHALSAMQLGDYSVALDLARTGERVDVHHDIGRDALLTAAANAAIARRSGDTARLREAWSQARPLLDRSLETWLLADQLTDLVATGARVGDVEGAEALARRLRSQLERLPGDGPAAAMAMWCTVQLDVAAERWDSVRAVPERWRTGFASDDRSNARVLARRAWAEVAARQERAGTTPPMVREAAEALAAVGDGWDASRLLGQAALDEPDPQAARDLLETARGYVSEPVDTSDRLVGAGLSEREAEVARLVADGHTYKEIGAQLYISPKTVEHHVAKIRQRLGAGSRAELLAVVRELVGE